MSPAPLLPIPYAEPLRVPAVEDQATQDFLESFVRLYERDRMIQAQNTRRLDGRGVVPSVAAAPPSPGHGLAVNSLTGLLSSLLCPSIKMGLQLSDGGNRNQVTVAFTYLGVGEFLLGNGATTTLSNIDITVAGANGLDTGSEAANTWYAVHIIAGDGQTTTLDPTANNAQFPCTRRAVRQAGLLSLSATAPTLPSGYSRFRRVGWVRNNGSSNFYQFITTVDGTYVEWNENTSTGDFLVLNTLAGATTFTDVSCAKVAPSTCRMVQLVADCTDTVASAMQVRNKAAGNVTYAIATLNVAAAANDRDNASFFVGCDSTQNVQYRVDSGTNDATLCVQGYVDIV